MHQLTISRKKQNLREQIISSKSDHKKVYKKIKEKLF
jgi:hypothetical protein